MKPSQLGKKLIDILRLEWTEHPEGDSGYLRRGLIPCGYINTKPSRDPQFWVFVGTVIASDGTITDQKLFNINTPEYFQGGFIYKQNSYELDADIPEQEVQDYLLGAQAYMERENKIRDIVGDDGMDVLGI